MKPFDVSYFFNLSEYQHAALFEGCDNVWEAITHIDTYLKAYPLGKIEIKISENVYLINPELISIGQGSIIEPGAYIKGPCVIGKNCSVRHGAYIRGGIIAGDNCVIGHDTEVKQTIFLNGACAAHFAYLGETILGNRVNIGAGTKCANLKLDHSPIAIQYEGQRIRTEMKKMGAIIGDDSQLGCNSVTNPGTLIGKNVFGYACLNFGGIIPSNSIVKGDVKINVYEKKLK